jgi:hypothetical protein
VRPGSDDGPRADPRRTADCGGSGPRTRRIAPPFFSLQPIDARLDRLVEGCLQQPTARLEGLSFTPLGNLARRRGLGKYVHLGDEGKRLLDGAAFRVRAVLKGSRRHRLGSGIP